VISSPPERSRTRIAPWIAGAVAAVLVCLVVVLATREPASNRQTQSPLIGRQAPAVVGTSILADGASFDLAAVGASGRWTVVNFFATWCGPCQTEHPELVEWERRHESIGDAVLVSVLWEDDVESGVDFFAQRGGDWPVIADDTDGRIGSSYGVVAMPESYVVDPSGVVRARITGGVTASGLDALLVRLQGVA
jgi:cytochrome c biogenesis protein CcmG, thiol:disulfide interchange protein DsbE